VPLLAAAGVNAFKIEGRMKSAEYVGTVTAAYRLVLDSLGAGDAAREEALRRAKAVLRNDFARSKTAFLFHEKNMPGGEPSDAAAPPASLAPPQAPASWLNPAQSGGTGIGLGAVLEARDGRGLLAPGAAHLSAGDSVRFHKADDSLRLSRKLASVQPDPSGGVWIPLPEGFGAGDEVYLIQTKGMSKRYPPVIPRTSGGAKRVPSHDRAPLPALDGLRKAASGGRGGETLAAGLYVMVSRVEDLYPLQSARPVKALLPYIPGTVPRLLGRNGPLPFPPEDIIIALDPFFPQAADESLSRDIPALREGGCRHFIVNNPGHFPLFRGGGKAPDAVLIAGPWLYTFNRWALGFVSSLGAAYFISPLENNRQNLERTFPASGGLRSLAFVTVFAWPSLFRVRASLRPLYPFKTFRDSRGERFHLRAGADGSFAHPEKPFSITDKIPFLREAGFSRFLLDLSARPLRKQDYRALMTAVKKGTPLPRAGRFNWKDGFYRAEEGMESGGTGERGTGNGGRRRANEVGEASAAQQVKARGKGNEGPGKRAGGK
jgi:putative protease